MKYQPQFPARFGSIEDAKGIFRAFFSWYNHEHPHAGIGLMAPDQVHASLADQIPAARQTTLDAAFAQNLERFVNKPPEPPQKPTTAWINPPNASGKIRA